MVDSQHPSATPAFATSVSAADAAILLLLFSLSAMHFPQSRPTV
jgi:hypothetical protein